LRTLFANNPTPRKQTDTGVSLQAAQPPNPFSDRLNRLMQPENHNGTATARRQMVLFNRALLIAKMSANHQRAIGCRFVKLSGCLNHLMQPENK